jgi:hypothetical protein
VFADYADAVSSPDGDMLAWRATALQPEGADPSAYAGFEILAAPLTALAVGTLDTNHVGAGFGHGSGRRPGTDVLP